MTHTDQERTITLIDTTATAAECRALQTHAIGRVLCIASRPERPGDVRIYDECRSIVLAAAARLRALGAR